MRREFSSKVKVAAFERSGGHCETCKARLVPGKFQYDHVLPDGLGGEPTLENCAVICDACHGAKTARQDVPRIAKAKRMKARHIGARTESSRAMPCGRGSRFRKRMDGTVIDKETGLPVGRSQK